MSPLLPAIEVWNLTTGSPGNSLISHLYLHYHISILKRENDFLNHSMDLEHSMEKNTESLFGGPYLTYTLRSTLLIICSLVLGSLSVKERGVLCVCVCVCLFSHVQLCEPMDCSPPDFSVHGILQAGKLECVAISYSRGSSQPRDQTYDSCVS